MREKPFDVFFSYNSEDRETVEKIAVCLEDQAGLKVWLDKWRLIPGEPWFRELERGLNAGLTSAVFVGKSGEGPWQQREVAAALDRQVKNPDFRVIPVLLPDAPSIPELPVFLAGNTWVEFSDIADDDALWRLECGIRRVAPERGRQRPTEERGHWQAEPQPHVDTSSLVLPGGALDVDSRFYIQRGVDDQVFDAIGKPRGLVTTRGPRQTGKTSLILRVHVNSRRTEERLRSVFVDFQALSNKNLESLGAIWRAIASAMVDQLGLAALKSETWETESAYDRNLTQFFDSAVFVSDKTPVLLCLDEVDRVFSSPLKSVFFSSLRAFYNRGAWDPAWKNVRWLLSTSSEPSFFIKDLNQSPFNIGLRVELGSFTDEETAEFARRHGLSSDTALIERIMDYVGGRPYLVHLLLYHLAMRPNSQEHLFDVRSAGGGIFLDHLKRYQAQFQQAHGLSAAMKRVIDGEGCNDVVIADRLEAAGLVKRDATLKVICHCSLYKDYFAGVL
jgi:hypothetical protein